MSYKSNSLLKFDLATAYCTYIYTATNMCRCNISKIMNFNYSFVCRTGALVEHTWEEEFMLYFVDGRSVFVKTCYK